MARSFYGTSYGNTEGAYGTTIGGGSIDMREELSGILRGDSFNKPLGHWFVYRRYDLDARSEYWVDEEYKESVGGPSWEFTDEVTLGRYNQVTSGGLARFFEQDTSAGMIHVDYRIYYMEHTVNPKKEDEIFEINWPDHSVRPELGQLVLPDHEKYNVNDVYPLRGDHGRIEFYACLCKREPIKS